MPEGPIIVILKENAQQFVGEQITDAENVNSHRNKPARLGLQFDKGELNFYACVVEVLNEQPDDIYDFTADVMNPGWNAAKAIQKMKDQPQMLACDALMDQHIFAGVGNIIKNEVLFRTRIHPKSLVGQLTDAKLKELTDEAVNYSFDFLKWKKEATLSKHWQAYEQKICPRDDVPLHKETLGKSHRGTYYCAICMKLYD
jgi:endonuclease-8